MTCLNIGVTFAEDIIQLPPKSINCTPLESGVGLSCNWALSGAGYFMLQDITSGSTAGTYVLTTASTKNGTHTAYAPLLFIYEYKNNDGSLDPTKFAKIALNVDLNSLDQIKAATQANQGWALKTDTSVKPAKFYYQCDGTKNPCGITNIPSLQTLNNFDHVIRINNQTNYGISIYAVDHPAELDGQKNSWQSTPAAIIRMAPGDNTPIEYNDQKAVSLGNTAYYLHLHLDAMDCDSSSYLDVLFADGSSQPFIPNYFSCNGKLYKFEPNSPSCLLGGSCTYTVMPA